MAVPRARSRQYALGSWLRDYKEQVFLFTRDFAVDWTNDLASHCTSSRISRETRTITVR